MASRKSLRLHRKCPCGSKKNQSDFFTLLPIKRKISEIYQKQHFGESPSIKSCFFQGKRFVLLGGTLVKNDVPEQDWSHPCDFLISHLVMLFGHSWLNEEKKKSEEEQHDIVKWFIHGKTSTAKKIKWDTPNGYALHLVHLAYDLFVLSEKDNMPKRLIDRLKKKENFNGARYEAFVFSTLIRAGFKIEYLDEKSGKNGKVVECRAMHINSGEYVAIEAKTRNVSGILGAKEGNRCKIKLQKNLGDSMEKNVTEPYVIFYDLNLPEFGIKNDNNGVKKKIAQACFKFKNTYKDKLPNLICFTNIPFHYSDKNISSDDFASVFITFHAPKFKLKNHTVIIDSIKTSIDKYAFLPKEFNEAENFAQKSTNSANESCAGA